MQTAALSAALVIAANVVIFFAAGQVRGGVFTDAWASYYGASDSWHRLIVAGLVYAAIIGPFTYAFVVNASAASFTQAVMGALMVLGLAVAVGGKALTMQMALATLAIAASSLWIAWAVGVAPTAAPARDAAASTDTAS